LCNLIWLPLVIVVKESNELGDGELDTGIPRSGPTLIRIVPHKTNALIA
jgi:hypothetical protein